jgi:hypothetical protein
MLTALSFLAHLAVVAALSSALVLPRWRPALARILLGLGGLSLVLALLGPNPRSLAVGHSFAAFDGPEIRSIRFPIEEVSAHGLLYGLVVLGFCAGWALWLRRAAPDGTADSLHPGAGVHPFWGPMTLCWSTLAVGLLLEKVAAPSGLVAPLAAERAILPPALAASVLLAWAHRRVLLVLAWLAVFVTFARIPLVVFGTLATHNGWGTSLDVHSITRFANPLAQSPVQVAAYSAEQLGWLIWAPNLLVMPGVYMLSLGGIGFAATMFVNHPKTGAGRPAAGAGG